MDKNVYHKLQLEILNAIDVILLTLTYGICWYTYYGDEISIPFYDLGNEIMVALFMVLYYFISHLYHGYRVSISRISDLIYSQTLAVFIVDGMMYVITTLINRHLMNSIPLIIAFLVQFGIIIAWSYLAHQWYFKNFPPKKTVIILGEGRQVNPLIQRYGMDSHFDVIRTLTIDECLADIQKGLDRAESIFLCGIHSHERNMVVKYCVEHGIDSFVIPRVGDVIMSSADKIHLFHLPILRVRRYDPSPEYLFFKRLIDIVVSLLALIVFAIPMLIIGLVIKSDGGTAFYKQNRLTKDGRVFPVYKFRSMRMDAEKDGVARLSTGENDPRITPIGHFIRAVRLDELPQLINILKGDMSIVGPRPERPEISAQYEKEFPEWNLRLQAKCGLTGYAQVYGQYNTTPYDKLLMDLMYISSPSLFEDFKIMFATAKILFMKESTEGVAEGSTTAICKKDDNTRSI